MSFEQDDIRAGGQIRVGSAGICPPIKEGDKKINGSMHAEGPVVFGDPGAEAKNRATLIVNRTDNDDEDCDNADRSVWVNGNMFLNGDDGTPYALNQVGNTLIDGNSQTPNALRLSGGSTVDSLYVDGDVYVTGKVDCDNKGRLASRFSSADARPKPFDIKHPSREGYRLRYACVEGPEVGVYLRGRVKNEKVIVLPSYWKDFVYIDSISVQLQPIGAHQDVIVKRWDDEKIYLQSRGGMPIDCFYHVYAERNDINPLITEYKGESCEDYPDPNHHKISEDERNYKDPEYATKQNIRTK
jgi:hypothetical protein